MNAKPVKIDVECETSNTKKGIKEVEKAIKGLSDAIGKLNKSEIKINIVTTSSVASNKWWQFWK